MPKGTVLVIDRIFIRSGAGDFDSITFKIPKQGKIPSGRFWVNLFDVNNNLDADILVEEKYPLGRFTLQIQEGISRYHGSGKKRCSCRCYDCDCNHPTYKKTYLVWVKNPNGSRFSRNGTSILHHTNSTGESSFISANYNAWPNNFSDGYNKHFSSLDALILWAKAKGVSQPHIDIFIERYQNKLGEIVCQERSK